MSQGTGWLHERRERPPPVRGSVSAAVITATYHPSGPASAPVATVTLDGHGQVTVTRHPDGGSHRGLLPPDALSRIRERVRTLPSPSTRPPTTEVGIGSAAAILHTSPPPALPLLVHFHATPASIHALDATAWRVPHAGDLVTVLAKVAAATLTNTLASVDTGLPAAIPREGVLLRFCVRGEQPKPTVVAYQSGRCEAWEDVRGWTGTRVGEGLPGEATVLAAHAAVAALVSAVQASRRPMPVVGPAHDPTQSLHVSFARGGQLVEWSTVWGRASRNDAPLEPVPESVPTALFDAAVMQLRALRDACTETLGAAPTTTAAPPPPLSGSELDALLSSVESASAPTPALPAATDPRVPWLAWLGSQLVHGAPHAHVLSAAQHPPPHVTVYGCVNGDDVQLGFSPPLDLLAFVTAVGIAAPLALSSDEHGECYRLVTASDGQHVHPYAAPQRGPWTVSASTSSFHQGRAVARWLGSPVFDATSLPGATVHGLVLTDTRVRSSP